MPSVRFIVHEQSMPRVRSPGVLPRGGSPNPSPRSDLPRISSTVAFLILSLGSPGHEVRRNNVRDWLVVREASIVGSLQDPLFLDKSPQLRCTLVTGSEPRFHEVDVVRR